MTEIRTLKKYTTDAKKIIVHKLGTDKKWMTDDNIAAIVNQLVYADQHYDETKGSLNNFRYHSAMIAIKRIVGKKKPQPISLSFRVNMGEEYDSANYSCELGHLIEDKKGRPKPEPEHEIESILNHECLTDLEKFYLREYFIEGKKQMEIANERGVTNRAVSFKLIKAINKLKGAFNVEDKE